MLRSSVLRSLGKQVWNSCRRQSSSFVTSAAAVRGSSRTLLCLRQQQSLAARYLASEAANRLDSVLKTEIEEEKKLSEQKMDVPNNIPGFEVNSDGAEVKLTKSSVGTTVTVTFNVNGSVEPLPEEEGEGVMECAPSFTVEIEKAGTKLAFDCEFVSGPPEPENAEAFSIIEVALYSGEYSDKVYAAGGQILDQTLYDHLCEYLAEQGIDNEFADRLSQFATNYEHSLYLSMLQKMRDFVSK